MIRPLALAVYGTLLTGMGNWRWALRDVPAVKERDTVRGYKLRSHYGYPAAFESSPSDSIVVDVFELPDTDEGEHRFAAIDSMEFGAGYDRRLVRTTGGRTAWLYVMSPDQASRFPHDVPNGDWRAWINSMKEERTHD